METTENLLNTILASQTEIDLVKGLTKAAGGTLLFGIGLRGVLQLRGMSKEEGEQLAKYRKLRDRSWFQLVFGLLLLIGGILTLFFDE